MNKVKTILPFQQDLPIFNIQDKIQLLYKRFYQTNLGKIYKAFPADEIVRKLKLKFNEKGPQAIFSPSGKIRLEFLKCYTGFSDKKLAEELISNINYQIFCGVFFPLETVKFDYKLISKIRVEIAKKVNIKEYQKLLYDHWAPYIKNKNIGMLDATCYESYISQPSNIKLVYKSVIWLDICIQRSVNKANLKRIRYRKEVIKRYKIYAKKKKKRIKETNQLKNRLLYILNKLMQEHEELKCYKIYKEKINKKQNKRIGIIEKIINQQKEIRKGEKVKDKIVNLEKEYVHTIIRGKEKKPYEYGAKIHTLQIDGVNFIEHLNFSAYNECKRMESTLLYQEELTGEKPKYIAGDRIYATNENRKKLTEKGIITNFKPKGREGKNKEELKVLRRELNRERNTRLEGSFGTEKEYYGDKRIRARTKETEIYQILVKIHCRNLLAIGNRMIKPPPKNHSKAS